MRRIKRSFPRENCCATWWFWRGHVGSLVEAPTLGEDRLRLLRDGGADQGNGLPAMSEDAIIRALHAVRDDAGETADKWVIRATQKTGRSSVQLDAAEKVSFFCCFLAEHNLMDCLRDLAPRRALALCVWQRI